MAQIFPYDEFVAGGAAPPQAAAAPAIRMSIVISAEMPRAPRYGYTLVRLVVNLPMIPRPLFCPPPPFFDWSLASQDVLDRFSAAMTPLEAEQIEIVDACFNGWRAPTEAEQARLDEIMT